jgi:hypothetical protein
VASKTRKRLGQICESATFQELVREKHYYKELRLRFLAKEELPLRRKDPERQGATDQSL